MIFRIFIGVSVLIVASLLLKIGSAYKLGYDLEHVPKGYALMPEEADVTVVEFISYTCKHCQTVHPVISEALAYDGRVAYIPRPTYLNQEGADDMARLAYAAGKQGAFFAMHKELIKETLEINEETVRALAKRLGLNADQLLEDMDSKAVWRQVEHNDKLFKRTGAPSIPLFIFNRKHYYMVGPKGVNADDFIGFFQKVRQD